MSESVRKLEKVRESQRKLEKVTTLYYFVHFYDVSVQITKTHLDVPFRTVSRGSRVPQG